MALDLHAHGNLDASPVRRYFRGKRTTPESRRNVHMRLARALVELDVGPDGVTFDDLRSDGASPSSVDVLASLIGLHADVWDVLVGDLRRSAPVAFPRVAAAAVLRLLAVDVAHRLGALLWLVDWPSERELPTWELDPNGPGEFLRAELARAEVTRDGLVDALEVDRNTVDAWLDRSVRPRRRNVEQLAEHLAGRSASPDTEGERRRIRTTFQRAHTVRELARRLIEVAGADETADILARVCRYALLLLDFVRASGQPRDVNRDKMRGTVLFGTTAPEATPWVKYMLRHLERNEPDPVWRTTLGAGSHWSEYLQNVASKLGPVSASERREMAVVMGRAPTNYDLEVLARFALADQTELARDPILLDGMASVRATTGAAAGLRIEAAERASRDPLRAIELLREAVALDPLDAEAHFRLGAALGQVGDIEAALFELRIAVALRPEWDLPRVEVAIVLLNDGRLAEALEALRAAERDLQEGSPWVQVHVAFVLEQLDQLDDAVTAYEAYVAHAPRDGEALDRLAHLLLARGDKRQGRERAKQAAHCGVSTVFDALEAGFYKRGCDAAVRPPHQSLLGVHFRPFRDCSTDR